MSNGPIILRDARRNDVPAIVRMLADDTLGKSREQFSDPLPDAYWTAFDAILRDDNIRLIVAEYEGEVVGTFQLSFLPGLSRMGALRAQIEAVRVADSHRSQGIGRRMMKAAIDLAVERGCKLVQLTTDKSRTDAHRFYEMLGFVASHEGMKLMLDETGGQGS